MQKKIFLQKNQQSGGRSHVKWLMWAAAALIVLVLATPLLVRHKNPREMSQKPSVEKGKVVREIPKAPAGSSENEPASATVEVPGGAVPPEAQKTADLKAPPQAGTDVKPANPADKPSDLLTGDPRKAPPWIEMQRKEAPVPGTSAADPTAGQQAPPKESRPAAKSKDATAKSKTVPPGGKPAATDVPAAGGLKTASLPPGATSTTPPGTPPTPVPPGAMKPPVSGKLLFCVQVGSFKDRKNADDLKVALSKKGYDVTVTSSVHPKLGQLYVVTLKPVDNMGKASTQVEQIKHEEKVKPIILKVPQGQ